MRSSSSWASRAVAELCVTFAVQSVGAMELCLPSLSAVPRWLHSLLSPWEGELWVRPGLGTPGSSWGEVPSALQLQNPGESWSGWQQTGHLQYCLCVCPGVMLSSESA